MNWAFSVFTHHTVVCNVLYVMLVIAIVITFSYVIALYIKYAFFG
jgi:hypothetical protein